MLHYTLNTGHTRKSPRYEVLDEVIDALAPLLNEGRHNLPQPPGYQVEVAPFSRSAMITIWCDDRPCITFVVAADDESAANIWPKLQSHYHALTDLPGFRTLDFSAAEMPATAPWCAAVTIFATPEEAFWMADFERCYAWAWIEKQ